jgi:adenylate cyclase class IV
LASELELKAVVEDPHRVRAALAAAGATPVFRGLLRDTRLDAAGTLTGRDQVLRLRRWIPDRGAERAELAWKGPTSVNPAGYKHREELELGVSDGAAALGLLGALGYAVTHAIDRAVEVYRLGETVARLEWYPRMDVLVEIEGPPGGDRADDRGHGTAPRRLHRRRPGGLHGPVRGPHRAPGGPGRG